MGLNTEYVPGLILPVSGDVTLMKLIMISVGHIPFLFPVNHIYVFQLKRFQTELWGNLIRKKRKKTITPFMLNKIVILYGHEHSTLSDIIICCMCLIRYAIFYDFLNL
jgi:hypothetical protein